MLPEVSALQWSISMAAAEFGVSRATVTRGLRLQGLAIGPQGKPTKGAEEQKRFTTQQIHAAICSDGKRWRAMKAREECLALERQRLIEERQLVNLAEVDELLNEYGIRPLRTALLSLHTDIDTRCNPTDPELARRELKAWADRTLQMLRNGVGKPGKKK